MHDIADALLRRGLARDQRLRPEPDDQRPGDNADAETNARPGQACKDDDHGVGGLGSRLRGLVRRRVLLSSSILSSCCRSASAMGSPSALRSRVAFASMASPTEMTARSGGYGREASVR